MAHSNFPQPFLWKNKDFTAKSKSRVFKTNYNKLTLSSAGAIETPLRFFTCCAIFFKHQYFSTSLLLSRLFSIIAHVHFKPFFSLYHVQIGFYGYFYLGDPGFYVLEKWFDYLKLAILIWL